MIKRIICEETQPIKFDYQYAPFESTNDLLIHVTDIHAGIEIHNWKNDFDEDILKNRIEKFTSDIVNIRELHNSENAYIVIGEIISGIIQIISDCKITWI